MAAANSSFCFLLLVVKLFTFQLNGSVKKKKKQEKTKQKSKRHVPQRTLSASVTGITLTRPAGARGRDLWLG